jgi:periplasmic divalent cation tolerance protein
MSTLPLRLRRAPGDCPARPRSSARLRRSPPPARALTCRSTLAVVRPIVLLSTAGGVEDATRLARALVEERLAACVNVVEGVRSVYRWQGAVQEDAEALLVIKTTAERYDALAERLRALHSYDTPELVRLEVAGGDARYLEWLVGQVRPGSEDAAG